MPLLILILAALIGLFEGRPLWRRKRRKEAAVFGLLLGAALLIGLRKALGLPSPLEVLGRWLDPAGRLLFERH